MVNRTPIAYDIGWVTENSDTGVKMDGFTYPNHSAEMLKSSLAYRRLYRVSEYIGQMLEIVKWLMENQMNANY